MTRIVDLHAHAFPDKVAERAVPMLEQAGDMKACLDGKISSLLESMDAAGIDTSVICSIATKPPQFESILEWSRQIASERIVPFLSVHPEDPEAVEHIRIIGREGFKGIKLHPYYQDFVLDEERMFPLYEVMIEEGLILLSHTGFDTAYPKDRIADPARICRVVEKFPTLTFVASHFGAWQDWDEVERHLLGKPIYADISFSLEHMPLGQARRFALAHPKEYLLFGTDSPWGDQRQAVANVRALGLDPDREAAILGGNAERLLGLV